MSAERLGGYGYIALTVLLTVYGQLALKWQMSRVGALPDGQGERLAFLLLQLLNPWVLSGFLAAFLASLSWMAAMTRFEISHAYPFMSLNFVIVVLAGALLFGESISGYKIGGLLLIILGIVLGSRG